ncbi:reprolysin-like metallopeptidase [Flavobacterium sp.]|uniref:reprolysin-like metallopeptidase n=1 Tax=Flavobacterium sp. TaxID=239 RepID=UPI002B4AE15D|nr:zinc-dependent metalloprotease family protein [Flavobacterium sp.]HLF51653.1 zinc-dependent metalloprotease family protein [Flavobacterium sp.]
MKKKLLISILTIFLFASSYAQKSVWNKVSMESLAGKEKLERNAMPVEFQVYSLDMTALKFQLQQAPSQDDFVGLSNVIIQFPNPDGQMASYRIYESSVMHPDLASKYQDIKTYVGQGIEDPTATINFSVTIFGLHTMTLSGKTGTSYMDPYTKDLRNYVVYSKAKLFTSRTFSCSVEDGPDYVSGGLNLPKNMAQGRASDSKFRTYRLAMACTIEYASYHVIAAGVGTGTLAQKKAAVLAAMNVSMARINGVYERDMSLKMQLVANNDLIIFIDSDNFSNTAPNTLINESQTVIDGLIGFSNYDIGHTVSTGGGGLAQRPSVCVAGKARGITGSTAPVGDAYDIDFVAHEIGHQFGANHTFAGDGGNCGGNRSNTTAVEPGSGTTIMAYAGICSPQNVQSNSDDYFHAVSLDEMFAHITGAGNCVVGINNGNATPVIPALSNYTIPNGTPFKLTSPTVTDLNGDVLTYCWEQNNGAFVTSPPASVSSPTPSATALTGTNFRSYPPTTSLIRYFPRFSDVLAGNLAPTWEVLPAVARTMAFRLTVRDNRTPNGGQTQKADMVLTYASGTPFAVTSQNTDGISWTQGTSQTITWNLGGTAVPATTAVNILLSTDGGLTYPTILVDSTPNDGTQVITVPNVSAPFCRIMVEPVNNVYYAINSKTFAIGYTVTTACTTYPFSTPIPVIDSPTYVTRTVTVPPTTATISDVNVNFSLTHTYMSDVQSDISSPLGPVVKTFERNCGNTNSTLNLNFDDSGVAIACGNTALQNVAPNQPLSVFNGQNPQGTWTFRVRDAFTGDTGTVNSASVIICTQTITLATQDFGLAEFSLYPNPNKGNFTIQFNSTSNNDVNITVHDLRGRRIFNKKYNNSGLFSQNLQLDHVQAGVYLVTVQDGDQKMVKRIIID